MGSRTGGKQHRREAEQEGSTTGGKQHRREAGQDSTGRPQLNRRKGAKEAHDMKNAGQAGLGQMDAEQTGCRTGGMQDRLDAYQVGITHPTHDVSSKVDSYILFENSFLYRLHLFALTKPNRVTKVGF